MKKLTSLLFVLTRVFACIGCGSSKSSDSAEDVKSEGVMTYEEYIAADLDTGVTVET